MNNITTYNDLLQEKQRLSLLLEERKILVKTEFEEIKLKLKPLSNIVEVVEKMSSKDTSNPLLNAGISMGVNFLLKNVLLRNAGWITRLILPVLAKNYLSHEVEEKNNIFLKIGKFFKRTFSKQHQPA
jgi:hypothetical protein